MDLSRSIGSSAVTHNEIQLNHEMLKTVLSDFSSRILSYFTRPIRLVVHGGAVMVLHPYLAPYRAFTRDVDFIKRSFVEELRLSGVYDAEAKLQRCIVETANKYRLGTDWMNADADIALPMAHDPQGRKYDPIYTASLEPNNVALYTIFTSPGLTIVAVAPFWAVALKMVRYKKDDPSDIAAMLRHGTRLNGVRWTRPVLEQWLLNECWAMGYASYPDWLVRDMRDRINDAVARVEREPPPSGPPLYAGGAPPAVSGGRFGSETMRVAPAQQHTLVAPPPQMHEVHDPRMRDGSRAHDQVVDMGAMERRSRGSLQDMSAPNTYPLGTMSSSSHSHFSNSSPENSMVLHQSQRSSRSHPPTPQGTIIYDMTPKPPPVSQGTSSRHSISTVSSHQSMPSLSSSMASLTSYITLSSQQPPSPTTPESKSTPIYDMTPARIASPIYDMTPRTHRSHHAVQSLSQAHLINSHSPQATTRSSSARHQTLPAPVTSSPPVVQPTRHHTMPAPFTSAAGAASFFQPLSGPQMGMGSSQREWDMGHGSGHQSMSMSRDRDWDWEREREREKDRDRERERDREANMAMSLSSSQHLEHSTALSMPHPFQSQPYPPPAQSNTYRESQSSFGPSSSLLLSGGPVSSSAPKHHLPSHDYDREREHVSNGLGHSQFSSRAPMPSSSHHQRHSPPASTQHRSNPSSPYNHHQISNGAQNHSNTSSPHSSSFSDGSSSSQVHRMPPPPVHIGYYHPDDNETLHTPVIPLAEPIERSSSWSNFLPRIGIRA